MAILTDPAVAQQAVVVQQAVVDANFTLSYVGARAAISLPQVLEDTSGMRHISDLPRTGLDSVLRVAASNVGFQEVPARAQR